MEVERSANLESVVHLRQGLKLRASLLDIPERVQQELLRQTTLGPALMVAKSWGSLEVEQVFVRSHMFSYHAEDRPERFSVLWGCGAFILFGHTTGRRGSWSNSASPWPSVATTRLICCCLTMH